MRVVKLDENAPQNRKKQFIKDYNLHTKNPVTIKVIEQHHIDGDHNNNEDGYSNCLEIYSESAHDRREAHKLIHALYKIFNYKSDNVFILNPDGTRKLFTQKDIYKYARLIHQLSSDSDDELNKEQN